MKRRSTRVMIGFLALLLCLAAEGSPAESGNEKEPEAPSAPDAGEVEPVVYRPPRLGSPREKVGGGVRGAKALPTPLALAPDHVALTTRPAPSLFWHLDGIASDTTGFALVLTLIDADGIEPLLETPLDPPGEAGIQRVRLSEHQVVLEPNREYEWSVSLIVDSQRRAQDMVTTGHIMRVDEPRLGGEESSAARYAELGLWYDALESLSDAIEAAPQDERLRAARSSLLRQAGLEAAVE